MPLFLSPGEIGEGAPNYKLIPLIPVPKNLHNPLIHPRTGGLQATVAGWASRRLVSVVRSGTGRPRRER